MNADAIFVLARLDFPGALEIAREAIDDERRPIRRAAILTGLVAIDDRCAKLFGPQLSRTLGLVEPELRIHSIGRAIVNARPALQAQLLSLFIEAVATTPRKSMLGALRETTPALVAIHGPEVIGDFALAAAGIGEWVN